MMKKDNIDKYTEIVKVIIENFNDTVKDLKKILRSYRFTMADSKVDLEIIGSDTKIIIDGFELDVLQWCAARPTATSSCRVTPCTPASGRGENRLDFPQR